MNKDKLLNSIGQIDPKYVENAEKQVLITPIRRRNWKKYTALAASAALFALVILGISFPSYARQIPVIGGIFELFDRGDGDIETARLQAFAEVVNLTGEIAGISITIDEAVFDGQTIYFTYFIESELELEEWGLHFYLSAFAFYLDGVDMMKGHGFGFGFGPLQQLDEHYYVGVGFLLLPTLPSGIEDGVVSLEIGSEFSSEVWQFSFPVEKVSPKESFFEDGTVSADGFTATITDVRISPLGIVLSYTYDILKEDYYGYMSAEMMINSEEREVSVANFTITVHDDLGNEYTKGSGIGEIAEHGRSGSGWFQFKEPVHEGASALIITLSMNLVYWDLGDRTLTGDEDTAQMEYLLDGGGIVETRELISGEVRVDIERD